MMYAATLNNIMKFHKGERKNVFCQSLNEPRREKTCL